MKESTIEFVATKRLAFWKTILVPVDFSELSKEALEIAVCLAERCGAKIILLHVVELLSAGGIGTEAYQAMESARKSLDQIADAVPTALVGQKLVRFGGREISQRIVETAREVSSDLIVLATHAYSFFKRALLGSTAEGVNRHASCQGLVVRQGITDNTTI